MGGEWICVEEKVRTLRRMKLLHVELELGKHGTRAKTLGFLKS